jgi:Holliday junction resolvase RusA-like endonuclease
VLLNPNFGKPKNVSCNSDTIKKEMQNLIIKRQPKAYQGSKTFKSIISKTNYLNDLKTSLRRYNPKADIFPNEELYGLVYYFRKTNTGTDADNISKPIWDCLKGILFDDDKQIKLRTAGIIDLSKTELSLIDVTGIPGNLLIDFLDAIETEEHIVYIECGRLNYSLFKFNIA